jgi:hypothetical protein
MQNTDCGATRHAAAGVFAAEHCFMDRADATRLTMADENDLLYR